MRARPATWLAWWVVLSGLWLLLVDTAKLAELCAGALAAALAATAAHLMDGRRPVALPLRARWLRRLPRALVRLPLDSGLLTVALVRAAVRRRRLVGAFRAVPWRVDSDDAEGTGRRALAKALDSLGPNSYVVGIDTERELMLVHQLLPPDDPASADPMELR